MNKRFIILIIAGWLMSFTAQAQELNAKVTVNADKIQSTNKNVFVTLEKALNQYINGTKWSATTFNKAEQIDCTFSLMILEQPAEGSFKAELFVQSRRPVYNSAYTTTLLNYRDNQFSFEYMEGAPIEPYQEYSLNSNLEAVIAFYANLILGMDFDSFSPGGGNAFFRVAQNIANQAQSANWGGWAAFDEKSRSAIINAYTDNSLAKYHELWYIYHRKGLDEMAANPDRGRMTVLEVLPVLKEIRQARSSEMLLQQFADAKLDEVVLIAEQATSEQKKETYDLLRDVFPSMSQQLQPLKK